MGRSRSLANDFEKMVETSRAWLEIRRSNDIARHLYEGTGFAVVGTRRNYYTDPLEDALILSRDGLLETP